MLFTTIGVAASDFFCINLSTISGILGMSESIAGVTFLAFGNGSPDVFSTFAAMNSNSGSLAIGELIGAASFITAVVSASMAFVRPFKVARRSFVRDVSFFILAITFSMYFLANGKLELWESIVMVAFYLFYVTLVVGWHWFLSRRKRRREALAAARGDFVSTHGELEFQEYHDEPPDDATIGTRQSSFPRIVTDDDFRDLEHADYEAAQTFDDLDEEQVREQWMGELSQNMRVTRPPSGRQRSLTVVTPIRPSLVGALEFQAVLASLKQSRNIQTMPIHLRRYSDDPNFTSSQQHESQSRVPIPNAGPEIQEPTSVVPGTGEDLESVLTRPDSIRPRAMTADDAAGLELDTNALEQFTNAHDTEAASTLATHDPRTPKSPRIALSPPASEAARSRDASPTPHRSRASTTTADGLLAPPDAVAGHRRFLSDSATSPVTESPPSMSPAASPRLRPRLTIPPPPSRYSLSDRSPVRSRSPLRNSPKDRSSARPLSPQPPALRLPDAHDQLDPLIPISTNSDEPQPVKHWPYRWLPPPEVLASTLFPTLVGWRKKRVWEKLLGLATAPSFFLLTITLPVVEPEGQGSSEDLVVAATPAVDSSKSPFLGTHSEPHEHRPHPNVASEAVAIEGRHDHSAAYRGSTALDEETAPVSVNPLETSSAQLTREWNRWLVLVQCFTGPQFLCLLVWANMEDGGLGTLLKASLWSLLGSTLVMLLLLFATDADRAPKWHFLLCFAGFVVSISWISTIANEVVGVLKTIGVIFDMSDAILGLTIFAVGNSLGDLVADVTVARLGFPVMALSACFGGPMLNILLGIGISGIWMVLRKEQRYQKKHPDRAPRLKPFHIEVSWTLLISAIGLLITLVCLLVLVPLNKWRMDRKIGFLLIGIWVVATVANVTLEILGMSDHWSQLGGGSVL